MERRIARTIQRYDQQGLHRTGTDVDLLSATWLGEEIKALGARSIVDRFRFKRVQVHQANVVIDGNVLPGVPLYDCGYSSTPVSGTTGPLGTDADIGVTSALPSDSSAGQMAVLKARRENRHKAIIVVTSPEFEGPGPALVNAEHFTAPFGPPVIQLDADNWPLVTEKVRVDVLVDATYVDATAVNIGTEFHGKDSSLPPLVIMTPRSGWWYCASERGGGIAAWLELVRHFVDNPPDRNVILTANTGHELGHTGLDHYLASKPDLVRSAHAWIHLGANFAAADQRVLLQFSDQAIHDLAENQLDHMGLESPTVWPPGERPFGEARNVFDGGGRFLSILGGNALFHDPTDRWPDAVDLKATLKWTRWIINCADQLARA